MNKICGIYKITSPTDKIYIGQSRNINGRKSQYKRNFGKNQCRIYNSIVKYGWENHKFEVIHECQESELNELERYYIKLYDTFDTEHGMNLTSGGDSVSREISEETRKKLSDAKKGTKLWLGKKHTEESKKKMSVAHIGKKSNLGKKRSEEYKLKMSIARKGKKVSEKHRLGIIRGLIGRKVSEETKQKISKANKGKKLSEEHKQYLNQINTGRKHTEEAKRKISEAGKNRICSEETRKKLSIANKGNKNYQFRKNFKHTEKTKQIIREKRKNQIFSQESIEKRRQKMIGHKVSEETRKKISIANKNNKTINRVGSYEIYNNENKLIYKFTGNFIKCVKNFGIHFFPFQISYRKKEPINSGKYKGWYAILLNISSGEKYN